MSMPKRWLPKLPDEDGRTTTIILAAIILCLIGAILIVLALHGYQ
jgi:hypothetical protein